MVVLHNMHGISVKSFIAVALHIYICNHAVVLNLQTFCRSTISGVSRRWFDCNSTTT